MPFRTLLKARLAPMLAAAAVALVPIAWLEPLAAQDMGPRRQREAMASPAPAPLPAALRTSHALRLPGRTLSFTASAGAIPITAADGAVLADVAYVTYAIDGADLPTRPIVFAFNGGPGSASTWLHLGTLGPWRLPLTAEVIAGQAPAKLVDNHETWLDLADLVLIDPPGTGFSSIWPRSAPPLPPASAEGWSFGPSRERRGQTPTASRPSANRQDGGPEWFWSLEGDIATFVEVIARWLERHGRRGAPIAIVGESYGGFRAPLIAEGLLEEHGIPVSALVLVSPVIDFDGRRGWRSPQHYTALLPSIAATRLERTGTTLSRPLLADAEAYARGDYLADLMRGPRDAAAVRRMSERIARLSGLALETVHQHAARLTIRSFVEGSPDLKSGGVSIYDAGMAGLQPTRGNVRGGFADPFTGGLDGALETAMGEVLGRLEWRPARRYVVMSREVNRRWVWPNSPYPPQALDALTKLHRKNDRLVTLVAHGFTDLVTPYFASALQLDQLPLHGAEGRIALEVYPGGHMFYSRDASRARFRADAERLIGPALARGQAGNKQQGSQRETP